MRFKTKQGIEVYFGNDGQIWRWTVDGQRVLASSRHAEQFVVEHFAPEDIDIGLRRVKTWTPEFRRVRGIRK